MNEITQRLKDKIEYAIKNDEPVMYTPSDAKAIMEVLEEQELIYRLSEYKDKYDFNIQIYNRDYNIFCSKDDVDLYEVSGHRTMREASEAMLKYLDRVNKRSTI